MENYFKIKVIPNENKPKNKIDLLYQNRFLPKYEELIIHKNLFEKLNNCINKTNSEYKNIDNLFIYGLRGSGKYTLAKYCIKEYIGNNIVDNLTNEIFESNNKEILYYKTRYHYEIIINKYNFNDIECIKNFLEKITNKNIIKTNDIKKNIILIKNINLINNNILKILKCYIEKNYINNTFILISNKIYPDCFKGLFIPIIMPKIKQSSFIKLGEMILKEENISYKKTELKYIYGICDNSLNKFKNLIELSYINGKYEKYKDVKEDKFKFLCKLIKKNDFEYIGMIREILNDILVENIDYKDLLHYLINYFSNMENKEKRNRIFNIIYNCDVNICKSYRILHHLEYLFVKIMNIFNEE